MRSLVVLFSTVGLFVGTGVSQGNTGQPRGVNNGAVPLRQGTNYYDRPELSREDIMKKPGIAFGGKDPRRIEIEEVTEDNEGPKIGQSDRKPAGGGRWKHGRRLTEKELADFR